MAVIGKIRERAGLLVGIVGFSIVVFIVGDVLTSGSSFFQGGKTAVGEIGGKEVDVRDFEARVNENIEKAKLSQGKETLDQATIDQIREQTWGEIQNEMLVGKQIEKTGLVVSSDEVFDMVNGKDPHPQVKQAFTDPKTGQFSSANVMQFLKNMDSDQTGKTRAQWVNFEEYIKNERLTNKYYDMIKGGFYVTKDEAQRDYINKNKTLTLRYVQLNYNTIVDSTVKPTDAEMQKAYNENKDKYEQKEETRKVDYVIYSVTPSADDNAAAQSYINQLVDAFQKTTDDSLFVASNSDDKAPLAFQAKGVVSPIIDSMMFAGSPGQLAGPYMENNSWKISKLVDVKYMADSVKASHILFKTNTPADSTVMKAKADSIYNLIKKGAKLSSFASLSEDPGSAAKEGDLGWFKPGVMVPEFNDFCFNNKTGSLGVVKTSFGYHIIEVTGVGAQSKQVKVATVARNIEASSKTFQGFFAQANDFAGKNRTAEAFDKAVKEGGLNMRTAEQLKENDKNIPNVDNARELVRWAYTAKKGEVSKAFEMSDKFVVAKVAEIKAKGYLPLEQVKDQVEVEARKTKKAEMLTEKINAAMSGAASIDQVAGKLAVAAANAENVNFSSPYLANVGYEPALVGTAFALDKNKISKAIKGEQGVYIAQVIDVKESAPTTDYKENKKQLMQQLGGRAQYETFNALKEKAKVQDFRGRFY
ncbi:MAG TPA: SurA N-terminal domain-containing protein [Bacteroidia bacterium]|nr:SurA N-terminal domain-containing protein [Bacteroidia bacterium]HNU33959.1 SurA N-terminal domain-containing protein [Bacteroidia bacterium]